MDYCLADGDGGAAMFSADPVLDVNSDGVLDAVRLDLDGDGLLDDALADLDGDGLAEAAMTDDGSGVWSHAADGRAVRWFGLDGAEHRGGPMVDVDADGQLDDRALDTDGDGLADRVLAGDAAYADTDGDGLWDLRFTDTDGDGRADAVGEP